jgi:XTP/dITP diphosphohydrolase
MTAGADAGSADPGAGALAPPPVPGAALLELVSVMDRLRTQCPWDAKQTHASLAPHLLEETYEALEALENDDRAALCEELGDVLLQVLFHARVASERTDGTGFTIDDVADGITAKLVRRHPHVFSDVNVSGADEVKQNWDVIKAAEREAASGGPGSALDGVPFGQPALSLAAQLQRRAARAGVPADLADLKTAGGAPSGPAPAGSSSGPVPAGSPSGPVPAGSPSGPAPAGSPSGPAPAGSPSGPASAGLSEIGAELFALAARATEAGLDPELELRAAARAYRDRVLAWERTRPAAAAPPGGSFP